MNSRSHGRLDVDATNVLPLLLQQTGKEVSSKLSVDDNFLLLHTDVSDRDVKAHDLLHLELDGGLDLIDLSLHVITSGDESGELSCLGKTGTKKTRDLLDHVVRGHEEIVSLGKLLDQLLVLVELLQVLNTHVVNTDAIGLLTVGSISKNTALKVGAGNGRKLEGSGETLVTDRIVVLQRNLGFDGFDEVTLLSGLVFTVDANIFTSRVGKDVSDSLFKECRVKLGHDQIFLIKIDSSEC